MSDGFSFTKEQMDAAKGAGFANPRMKAEWDAQQKIVADARRRGDDCEARVLSGAVKAAEIPLEERQRRSQIETMFSGNGLTPWHELPTARVLPGTATTEEALAASGLDWLVEMKDLLIEDPEWRRAGEKIPARAIVRTTDKRVLGAAGVSYTPVQNRTLFEIGDGIARAGAAWETAGSMFGGRQVWALMRIGKAEGDEVTKGDPVKTYLLLRNNHDGRRSAEVMLTDYRPVCRNSMRLALSDAAGLLFRYRHTRKVEDRLAAGAAILEAANAAHDRFVESAQKLALTRYPTDAQQKYLAAVLGIKANEKGEFSTQSINKLNRAKQGLNAERALAEALGANPDTAWVAFNAVTRFTSHDEKVVRGDADRRLSEMLDGAIERTNATALEMALDAADGAVVGA